jgi:hypothetical protein
MCVRNLRKGESKTDNLSKCAQGHSLKAQSITLRLFLLADRKIVGATPGPLLTQLIRYTRCHCTSKAWRMGVTQQAIYLYNIHLKESSQGMRCGRCLQIHSLKSSD